MNRITEFSVADNDLSEPISSSFAKFDKSSFEGNGNLSGKLSGSSCNVRRIWLLL